MDDHDFMRLAIAASDQALALGNMPFGAALASADGRLLHVAGNDEVTSGDLTGHAETALLRQASMRLGREALRGATVYASGEPCAMCSGAMFWAGVARVVYAATAGDIREHLGGPGLASRCADVLGQAAPPVAVTGELLRDDAVAVYRKKR